MQPSTERAREAYYERMMSAEHDIGGGPRVPTLRYCIASTPRSGSTLLSRTLHATGRAGVPMEYLSPALLSAWRRLNPASRQELRSYVADLEGRRTTENGVFGLKLHWAQLHNLAAASRAPIAGVEQAVLGAHTKFILIRRRDKLSQAISLHIANQTRVYHSDQREFRDCEPVFDSQAISAHVARIFSEEADWRAYLDQRDAERIEVCYEELVADHRGTCRRVLEFLGMGDVAIPAPTTEKLADGVSADFRRRYLAELFG